MVWFSVLSVSQSLERDLQSRVQEVSELQQQLQSSEREKQTIRQQLTAELTRAERDYQERAAAETAEGQGASSGTAADSDGKIAVVCVVLFITEYLPDCRKMS